MSGLSSEEARKRLLIDGPNEIEQEKRSSALLLAASQFKSPLVAILIVASVVSGSLGEWPEAIAIVSILVINAGIGFFQEYRAESAVLALKNMTSPRARVVRDGRQELIAANHVVRGDVLLLESGDIVAADGSIEDSARLLINEAVLTGESFPVEKGPLGAAPSQSEEPRFSRVFTGTAVTSGVATVTVTATGMKTELGKIAHLMTTATNEPTPLQVQLAGVGKRLLYVCLAVVALIVMIGIAQERTPLELAIFSVSLAVAAVPEGLPAIVTLALALGVQRMAERNAWVRKLPSVETLGSVSVICTDKTGTLTTGNMRVREIWGDDHVAVIKAAASCCDADISNGTSKETGDPTEIAILLAARERAIERKEIEEKNPRVKVEPFDSVRKRMSVLRKDNVLYVKGAFETVMPLCAGPADRISKASLANQDMTTRALRVLAVAIGKGSEESDLEFIGLIGISDPPRSEVIDAIKEAREAGVTPIMITGDHPATAAAIARELGLVLEGEAIEGRVYSRATPEDKINLIRQWKAKGALVAMTGDGVNDAPAIREAHIGIAMGKAGTEVTRQSADLVLADDNFATIVAAIREGRGVYQNIRKAVTYLLSGNFAELAVVMGASVLSMPIPLQAAHLLWINLVTDSLPALALIADPVTGDVMKRPPRNPSEPILGRPEWKQVAAVGIFEAVVMLVFFQYVLVERDDATARSMLFTTFVFSQLWRSFGARSRSKTYFEVRVFSNMWLVGVVGVTAFLQATLHYLPVAQKIFELKPLVLDDFILILPVSMISISVIEILKLVRRRH